VHEIFERYVKEQLGYSASSFAFNRRKKIIWVWNNKRERESKCRVTRDFRI